MIKYQKVIYLSFNCPDCHLVFSVDSPEVGKNITCPRCGTLHTVIKGK